jgi:long-chain acyl-CoA synthetase
MDINPNNLTLKLREIAESFPEDIAVQIKTEGKQYKTYTYREFYQKVKTIGNYLISNSIKPNDKIVLLLENRLEWGMVYFGILFSGAIAVPIDTQTKSDDLKYFIEDSESALIFTSKKILDSLNKNIEIIAPKIKVIILDGNKGEISASLKEKSVSDKNLTSFDEIFALTKTESVTLPVTTGQNIASILYTSGTTGRPKGVMLTHQNYFANFQSIVTLKLFSEKQNILSILPLHHSFPFMATLLIPLFLHCKITYLENLNTTDLLECMQETKVTALVGVPQLFNLIQQRIYTMLKDLPFYARIPLFSLMNLLWIIRKHLNINPSKLLFAKLHKSFGGNLKFVVSGGAKLESDVAKFFLKLGFNLYEGYGLTETSPIVTINTNKIKKIDSVGTAIPDVKIKINEPDNLGIGEILIQGPNVMQGYYKRERETNEVIKDNWFYSGDLGYIDNSGYLYITGRKKELIVLSSGKNISPEEVELHYAKDKLIKEICILSVFKDNEEKLMAVIVPDLDYCQQKGISDIHGEIKWTLENLARDLPSYKRIMGFIITTEELPRTRLGKLKRYEIQAKYSEDLRGEEKSKLQKKLLPEINKQDLMLLNSSVSKQIIAILNTELNTTKNILLDDHLEIDLGVESLKRMELIALLEKQLNIKIPYELLSQISTVRDLINIAEKLSQSQGSKTMEPISSGTKSSLWHDILAGELPDKIRSQIALSDNAFSKVILATGGNCIDLFCKLLWRIKVEGALNLPKNEPIIFCSNHNSFLDGFIIRAALPKILKRKTFFLAIAAYFKVPVLRDLIKIMKVIPIDPSAQSIAAMQASAFVLKNGKAICIFPEGERSIDGKVKEFKNGIGILAKELNVRLVPTYIQGSFEAWPRNKRFPKPHLIKVIFGEPCDAASLMKIGYEQGALDDYEAISLGVREKVVRLS